MKSPSANTADHYHGLSKLFHWLIAALIVLQFVSHEMAEAAAESGARNWEFALILNHKSIGMTVLMLALARLVWRFVAPPPKLPTGMPTWQIGASHVSHVLLYGLMLALPLTGWLMSSAAGVSVAWFKLAYFPDLIGKSDSLADSLHDIHEILGKVLFVTAIIHILAALKHGFVDRDGVLARICSVVTIALGVLIVGAGAWWLTLESTPAASAQTADSDTPAAPAAAVAESSLPAWQIDPTSSFIRFTGTQSGESFTGEWQNWQARIHFDTAAPDEGLFDVSIDASSAATGDDDRDATIVDAAWFDAAEFPEVIYRASRFRTLDDGRFAADGELIIKGQATPVTLTFAVSDDGEQRSLTGSAALRRLELGVGTGEWEDTAWVDDEVAVEVRVDGSITTE